MERKLETGFAFHIVLKFSNIKEKYNSFQTLITKYINEYEKIQMMIKENNRRRILIISKEFKHHVCCLAFTLKRLYLSFNDIT